MLPSDRLFGNRGRLYLAAISARADSAVVLPRTMDLSRYLTDRAGFYHRRDIQKGDVDTFEDEHELELPERLRSFLTDEASTRYEGMYAYDLPFSSGDSKFPVSFVGLDMSLFEDHEVAIEDYEEHWIPLATLGDESEGLAVNLDDAGCRVGMWSHETGMFEEYKESLDEFLGSLLKKGEQTPIERLKSAVEAVELAWDKDDYNGVLSSLDRVLPDFSQALTRLMVIRAICRQATTSRGWRWA